MIFAFVNRTACEASLALGSITRNFNYLYWQHRQLHTI